MTKISKHSKIQPNDYYSKLIKSAYIGAESETNMFMQFLYFSYVLSNFQNEFTTAFYAIAQDDLDHHSMLGECLIKLGGDPDFVSNKNVALSGRDFEYFKGIKQMLEYGISKKEKALINYKILINKIAEKEIKNILEIIVCDEQKHKEILENLLKKYTEN